MPNSLTNGEHNRICKLHIADTDVGDEPNEARHYIRVVYIDGLCNGLEPIKQSFCMLREKKRERDLFLEPIACLLKYRP